MTTRRILGICVGFPGRPLLAQAALFFVLLFPALSFAGPSGAPLLSFGEEVLRFLTGPLAYIVFGIGLAIAAISLVMGSRDGLQRAMFVILGGALLFGVDAVVAFVRDNVR